MPFRLVSGPLRFFVSGWGVSWPLLLCCFGLIGPFGCAVPARVRVSVCAFPWFGFRVLGFVCWCTTCPLWSAVPVFRFFPCLGGVLGAVRVLTFRFAFASSCSPTRSWSTCSRCAATEVRCPPVLSSLLFVSSFYHLPQLAVILCHRGPLVWSGDQTTGIT